MIIALIVGVRRQGVGGGLVGDQGLVDALRLLQADDIARVDAITSLYSQFLDRTNFSTAAGSKYVDAHRLIYARYPTDRTAIQTKRTGLLESIERLGGHGLLPVPITFDPQPLLFSG